MNEVLSFAVIKKRFDSEWVLLGDPEATDILEIKRGRVLWHSKNRDEVYRKAREIRPLHSAIIYTGQLPEDAAIVL